MKNSHLLQTNILCANLVNVQLISKFNKGIRFLLCDIDIFSKFAWAIPLKDKNGITTTDAFTNESNRGKINELMTG